MTIAEQLALEAKELNFEELPSEVNDQAKRSLLDSLAIAFAGYLSEPSRIIQSVIRELNGPAESTIFGTGLKTSCLYATLANGTMVHYFDYMDAGFLTKEATVIMGHHGELIAPILAVGERQHVAVKRSSRRSFWRMSFRTNSSIHWEGGLTGS